MFLKRLHFIFIELISVDWLSLQQKSLNEQMRYSYADEKAVGCPSMASDHPLKQHWP